jgi:hypothetical protein
VLPARQPSVAGWLRTRRKHPDKYSELPVVRFTDHILTERFTSAIPELTPKLSLELGMARQIETFTRSDNGAVLWGLLDLGKNVVQISVPVTYRYHVQLRDEWKLSPRENKVIHPTG